MEERLKPVRTLSFGLIAAALVAAGPWVGWWPLLPLALAARGMDARRRRAGTERPA